MNVPPGEEKIEFPTAKLMDSEASQVAAHREKIVKIVYDLENALIEGDCTMGDLAEIMDLFNARAHAVFSTTKIKDIKTSYGTNN